MIDSRDRSFESRSKHVAGPRWPFLSVRGRAFLEARNGEMVVETDRVAIDWTKEQTAATFFPLAVGLTLRPREKGRREGKRREEKKGKKREKEEGRGVGTCLLWFPGYRRRSIR